MLKDYLKEKNISIKQLSSHTGIAYSTVNYIVNNRTPIEKCSGETLYKIARYLEISMDQLYEMNRRYSFQDFEVFKGEMIDSLKSKSQTGFLLEVIKSDEIEKLWENNKRVQALYLLSMVDYLSRINGIPVSKKYSELRKARIEPEIVPMSKQMTDAGKMEVDHADCIPEFLDHGFVETGKF